MCNQNIKHQPGYGQVLMLSLVHDIFCTSDIVAAAVLSGNRNFEGRVHPLTRANYLASPPLVVAYAIAGTVRSLSFNYALDILATH